MKTHQIVLSIVSMFLCFLSLIIDGYSIYIASVIFLEVIIILFAAFDDSKTSDTISAIKKINNIARPLLNWSGQKKMKKIKGFEFLSILFNGFAGAILLVDSIKNGEYGYIYASSVCLMASFIAGFLFEKIHQITELKEMYNTEVECNLKQRAKIYALKLEIDEKFQELELLRQKHSRTNQPRVGGKFVKKENIKSC